MFVVDSIDEAIRLSAADETGARFATAGGAVVWPTGKLTLGTQVSDTEGVLARASGGSTSCTTTSAR